MSVYWKIKKTDAGYRAGPLLMQVGSFLDMDNVRQYKPTVKNVYDGKLLGIGGGGWTPNKGEALIAGQRALQRLAFALMVKERTERGEKEARDARVEAMALAREADEQRGISVVPRGFSR